MDYRKTPHVRPWSRDLQAGDTLTGKQARCIDGRRLQDFGLELVGIGAGCSKVVRMEGPPPVTDDSAAVAAYVRDGLGE